MATTNTKQATTQKAEYPMTTTNQTDDAQTPTIATTAPHTGDAPPLTVQALAAKYALLFTVDTRSDGTTFYHAGKEADRPAQLSNLIETAHGEMSADDYKYQYIVDTLNLIAESNEGEEEDAGDDIESDPYNADLLRWLGSDLSRSEYVDDYMEDTGASYPGLYAVIGNGQVAEQREVFYSVLSSLQTIVDDAE